MKEKTAVAVLRNLNLRVGEVQPQLDGAIRKAFQTRYAKMPDFQLYGTAYEFVYEEKRIRLCIELTVDFGVFLATAGIVRKVSAGISVGEEGRV